MSEIVLSTTDKPLNQSTVYIKKLSDSLITLECSQFINELGYLLKNLSYTWNSSFYRWQRELTYHNGLVEDRYIELCYKLLKNNFCITIDWPELQEKIITKNYIKEHTKWIVIISEQDKDYPKWFALKWSRKDDFYSKARTLPCSKWSKPYVVVPPEHYLTIQDFAELYNFKLSNRALEIIKEQEEKKKKIIRIELQDKKEDSAKKENFSFRTNSEKYEVLDEFKDDKPNE